MSTKKLQIIGSLGSSAEIYVQDVEPTDANDGAVWVDTATDPEVYIGLPDVTAADNNNVLQVVDGQWQVAAMSATPDLDENGVLIF